MKCSFCCFDSFLVAISEFGGSNWTIQELNYCRQTSNISGTLVGNKIVDHSDVVGASTKAVAICV